MYMCTHGVCKMRNKIYVCVKIIERDYAHLLKARIIGLFDLYLGPLRNKIYLFFVSLNEFFL